MGKQVEKDNIRYKFEDEQVWSRLSQALSVGAYIEDACVFAGISSRQYRRWRVLAEQGVMLPAGVKYKRVKLKLLLETYLIYRTLRTLERGRLLLGY